MGYRAPLPIFDRESVEDRIARPYRDAMREARHVLAQREELLISEAECNTRLGRLIARTLGDGAP